MSEQPVPTAIVKSGAPASPETGTPPPEGATVIPTYSLYSRGQIGLTTFLCGPLAGGWMLFTNWRRLREPGKARFVLIGTIVTIAALLALAIATPNIPHMPLGLAGLVAILALAAQQRFAYDDHVARGGARAGNGAAALVGVLSLLVLLVAIVGGAVVFFLATRAPEVDFGDDHTVQYTAGGTEAEARAVGENLQHAGFFLPNHPASVGVRRSGTHHVVEFVIQDQYIDDLSTWSEFRRNGRILSNQVFHDEPVDIWLDNDMLEPKKKLVWGDE